LHAKLRILRPDEHFVGLAILAQAGYGTGGARFLSAEPGFFYWPQAIIEKRFGSTGLRMGLNGGFRGHTGKNPVFGNGADGKSQLKSGAFEYSNLVTAGFGIGYRVLGPLNLDAETYMTYQLGGASDAKQRLSAEAIGGLKLFIQDSSFLMAAAGGGYLPGFQSAGVRAVLGFVFEPPMGDKDHDGIKDDEDDCPEEPEDFDGFQDTRMDSPPGQYGCPDPDEEPPPRVRDGDRDGDGILDSRDQCPDKPEDFDGFKDKDGCPDPDNDGDGIPDVRDRCRNDPEDQDGFKDEDGCPEPDNDGDGIPDGKDSCKNEPETYNGTDDNDGCPDKGSVIVQKDNVLILEKILFETGSAKILPASFGILDAVTTTLKHHPEFTLLEVQGHADIRGDEKGNVRLTQARADSVVDALVKRGLPSSLLRSMGYGAYCPVDPGRTPEAFEKNRRVEFKIVRTNKGPTGVELGCDLASSKGITPKPP
jgi:outer membrane protein OmpA-like peptidoglycan-associated protein